MKSQRGKTASLVMTVDHLLIWTNYANFTHTHITRLNGSLILCLVHNKYLDSDTSRGKNLLFLILTDCDFVSVYTSYMSFLSFAWFLLLWGLNLDVLPEYIDASLILCLYLCRFSSCLKQRSNPKDSSKERKNWENIKIN